MRYFLVDDVLEQMKDKEYFINKNMKKRETKKKKHWYHQRKNEQIKSTSIATGKQKEDMKLGKKNYLSEQKRIIEFLFEGIDDSKSF